MFTLIRGRDSESDTVYSGSRQINLVGFKMVNMILSVSLLLSVVCVTQSSKYSRGQLRLRVLVQGSYERLRPDSQPQRRRPDMEELRDRATGTSPTADE